MMINLKSSIAYLAHFVGTRRDISTSLRKSDHIEMIQQLEFAIDELKMHEAMIKDIASGNLVRRSYLINPDDEKLFDSVANNGEAL